MPTENVTSPSTSWWTGRWGSLPILLGLYALALSARIVAGLVMGGMSAPPDYDEPEYYAPAVYLVKGEGYIRVGQQSVDGIARPTAYRMPGPALVMAFVFALFGPGVELARWTAAAVGALSAPLMCLFARRFLPVPVAALSGAVCAVYPTWIFYCLGIYSEAYFIPALLVSFVLTARAVEKPTLWAGLLAGLAWGVTTHMRPHALPMAGLATAYVFFRLGWRVSWRPVVGVALGVLALMVPWVVRNQLALGHPILLATEGGETLLGSNNPYVVNNPKHAGMWVSPMSIGEYRNHLSPIQNEVQRDAEQKALAVRYLRDNPALVPQLALSKLWRWLTPVTASGGMNRVIVLGSYGVLLVLLLVGAFLGVFRSSPELYFALLWTVLLSAITAVYWGGLTRGRIPLEIVWLPWGTAVAYQLCTRFARFREPKAAQCSTAGV